MKISEQTEPLVREVLDAIVKAEPERVQRALAAFPDEESMTEGYRLAAAVALYVLQDHYGRQPTEDEIHATADKLVEQEGWTDITADEVVKLLAALYARTRVDEVMPLDRAVLTSYVLAADLLGSCHREGEWWFDYLDRAEAAIEAS